MTSRLFLYLMLLDIYGAVFCLLSFLVKSACGIMIFCSMDDLVHLIPADCIDSSPVFNIMHINCILYGKKHPYKK